MANHEKDLCHLKLALEKIEEQNKIIQRQQSKLGQHEKQIRQLSTQMATILGSGSQGVSKQAQSTKPKECSVSSTKTAETTSLGIGEFLWQLEIPMTNYPPRMMSKATFHSSSCGYNFMIVFIKEIESNVSILFRTIQGLGDDALEWPMKAKISISVVRGKSLKAWHNVTFVTTDSKIAGVFEKPNSLLQPSFPAAVEIPHFVQHKNLNAFIIDGKLTIKVKTEEVEASDVDLKNNGRYKVCTGERWQSLAYAV